MWKRIKNNLDSGIGKIKWFSSLLNERVRIEISLFRLLYKASEMEKRKSELLETIGKRVYEIRQGPEKNLVRDHVILETLDKLEEIDAEIAEVRKKTSEIDGVEA